MKLQRFQIEYVRNCWQVWLEGNNVPDYIRVKYLNRDNDKNKDIEELMIQNNINVYYFNINNLLNKNEILDILKYTHNNLETAENLWIFYKGHFIGSRNDALKLINKIK